jgi:CHAT domain-containing protein
MAELYERADQYDEAQELTQHAILAAQRVDAPEALYRWQWQSARLLKAQGRTEQAISAYQSAVHTLQGIRQDLATGYGGAGVTFRQAVGSVYLELADLLLQRSAAISDPVEVNRILIDARDTVELLKGAELEDYFQDDCVAALKAKTTGIDQLADRTAAIYPIMLPDRTELLLSTPEGLKRFTAQVGADTLTDEVRAFRRRLEKRTTHQYLPHAKKLYEWIILPIEAELKRQNIDTLVIVPDGALRTIPMAALYDGKQFLGARYALATTPGLTLTDPRPIERQNVQLLITGLTESVQGFPALPYVAQEIESIRKMYGGTVLQDQDFVAQKMEKALADKSYSIVHIASHAQFDRDITKTFLLTYDSKLSMDSLENFLGLAKFREEGVELLTLSACQTAAGDDRAALGLAGVAIKAGARSALATLWTVNDPASALLVSEFYRQLLDPSVSKAKALQQAQLKLLADRRYRHPGYWSPFLLIGNWL